VTASRTDAAVHGRSEPTDRATPDGWRPALFDAALLEHLAAGFRQIGEKGIGFAIRRMRLGASLLFSLPQHLQLLRVLSHPQTRGIARKQPLLAYKYLLEYVALDLPVRVRRAILIAHFRFLQRTFDVRFVDCLDRSPPTLWRRAIGGMRFDIGVQLNNIIGREGEFVLTFNVDGREAYRLVFLFAPGSAFGLSDAPIIVVSCVQGMTAMQCIRLATKACLDIQPAHLLMAALGGFAQIARIPTILGVHQTRQIWQGGKLLFAYDKFFETYGREIPEQRMYSVPVPYNEKPLADISPNHRARTQRKRRFKEEIHREVVRAIGDHLL
jgi:uncharacterized protein VirK/YbjX